MSPSPLATLLERAAPNLSVQGLELSPADRVRAAAEAGFGAVEWRWPFGSPFPEASETDPLVDAVIDTGLRVASMNLWGGDLAAGERGILSHPDAERLLLDHLDPALAIAERLGAASVVALYGNRIPGVDPRDQDDHALRMLGLLAPRIAERGIRLLLEPVSGVPGYPLTTSHAVVGVIERAGVPGIGMLADLYHLAVAGEDPVRAIQSHAAHLGHVQLADCPGRGAPGTGALDIAGIESALQRIGYAGWVGLEYEADGRFAEHRQSLVEAGGRR